MKIQSLWMGPSQSESTLLEGTEHVILGIPVVDSMPNLLQSKTKALD